MSTNENFTPQSTTNNPNQLASDPNVRVPDHVAAAAKAADELHKQLYTAPTPEPQPDPAAEEAARAAQAEAAQAQQADPNAQPQHQEQRQPPADDGFNQPADQNSLRDSEWARRYNSMKGRYDALTRTVGSMEEQMRQMSVELVRTQELLATGAAQPQQRQTPTDHGNLITDADRENYGDELIDLARRSALSAVTPELEQLRATNADLSKKVSVGVRRELFATLDRSLPNWREINVSPQFKGWLRLPNVYTGALRGNMLKAAVDGAEAPKVIALFRDFLAEANATGQTFQSVQQEQQDPAPVPRVAALNLETLAAPGRARPASGDSQVPSEKPIYSRAQISTFYNDKRRGVYAGRDAEVAAFEADLGAAQREGRIR